MIFSSHINILVKYSEKSYSNKTWFSLFNSELFELEQWKIFFQKSIEHPIELEFCKNALRNDGPKSSL